VSQRYRTPEAFRQALEQRLRTRAGDGLGFARARQLLVFDRFLARVGETFGDAVTLKGGLVLEIRLARARTTKDVDLRLTGSPSTVLARLQAAGRIDLGDFMAFELLADADHAVITSPGMRYHGQRFRAVCRLAGKVYGQSFGVDVGFGDPMFGTADVVAADDVLGFAGLLPPTLRLYPVVTHIAEKLHAYTLPRMHPNSRVKDLPDLALLASIGELQLVDLRAACEQTFSFRGTHALPDHLPAPPDSWQRPYAAMARDDRLRWSTLAEVTAAARAVLDPMLRGDAAGTWQPHDWQWQAR
jgi:hypothetical protein